MGHRSKKLDQYIGKYVKVDIKKSFHSTEEPKGYCGVLQLANIGFRPYVLVTEEFDLVFTKSHVANIEEV